MPALIAPLVREVERELGQLHARLVTIARRYVRRLVLEPYRTPGASQGSWQGTGAGGSASTAANRKLLDEESIGPMIDAGNCRHPPSCWRWTIAPKLL